MTGKAGSNIPEQIQQAIQRLDSYNPAEVIEGVNFLLKKTYECTDLNTAINVEKYPKMMLALGSLLDAINPIGVYFGEYFSKVVYPLTTLPLSTDLWTDVIPILDEIEFKELSQRVDDNLVLCSTVAIIRNLSFEAANELILACSAVIVRHLVSLVLAQLACKTSFDCSQLAFDALVNISTKIELAGRKRLYPYGFLDNTIERYSEDDEKRALFQMRTSKHYSGESTPQYLASTMVLLPIISYILEQQNYVSRGFILSGLEMLARLASSSDNAIYLDQIPTAHLDNLLELVCTSVTWVDNIVKPPEAPPPNSRSEKKEIAFDPSGRSRPKAVCTHFSKTAIGQASYFNPHVNDIDVRDACIDVIAALCTYSINLQLRFGEVPRLIEIMFYIATTSTMSGLPLSVSSRSEGKMKAAQILNLLLSQPLLAQKFFALQTDLFASASSDEFVCELVCKIHNMYTNAKIEAAALAAAPT